MNRTDYENFYCHLIAGDYQGEYFDVPDRFVASYFMDVEEQPCLRKYNPDNVADVRAMMDGIFTKAGYEKIKEECIRLMVKNIIAQSNNSRENFPEEKGKIDIPEFIYNF